MLVVVDVVVVVVDVVVVVLEHSQRTYLYLPHSSSVHSGRCELLIMHSECLVQVSPIGIHSHDPVYLSVQKVNPENEY